MNLDEELRTTLACESERLEPPAVDAHDILARGKLRRLRRTTLQAGAAAAVLTVLGMGVFGFARADRASTWPAIPPTPTTTASAPTWGVLGDWDCGASQCLTAGTHRVRLGIGDEGEPLSAQLLLPWSDWASDGFRHRVWKESGGGSVGLSVYEIRAVPGPQQCDAERVLALEQGVTVNGVVGRLSDLPQFTVAEGPTVVPAFGREAIHLRIQADSLRCEGAASGDQYVLAGILGGDGLGTYGNLIPTVTEGESTLEPGRRVVVDFWVLEVDGQNIVVEARQEGSPTATTVTQLDQVRQSVRFVPE
ncbi:hypothetical protein GCM10023168_09760 [Fodinibacter luteus]|uniref:Uncharacterized protein n=1 Tax=Fodinibacter luteus TaxID=552064 RepID=A0ABP8K5Q0_9MICO